MADKYIVVRLGSLGDVILTTGVLNYWNKTMQSRFIMVTRASFADVFLNNPCIDKIIPVYSENLTPGGWLRFCQCLRKSYSSMDVIDLHGNIRTALLKRIWPEKVHSYPKMSFIRRLYSVVKHEQLKNRLLEKNIPQRYSSALPGIKPDQSELVPRIFLSRAEILQAEQCIKRLDSGRETVCIHPYATHKAKTWPKDKWKHLVNLLKKNRLGWIIIGQSSQALFPGNPRDLTGRTSIRETGAILSKCSVLVSADSGPIHLAAGVNTPVVGLFGPTSREWGFYPAGRDDVIIEPDLKCRPCSLHGKAMVKCRERCMDMLQPEQILSALNKILDRKSSARNDYVPAKHY